MGYKVSIDAGHGMNTSGKRTPPMTEDVYVGGKLVRNKGRIIHEFEFNVLMAKALGEALKRCGIEVYYVNDMSGATDTPLSTRATRANNWGSNVHISCHYNAVGNCSSFQSKCSGLLVLKTVNRSSNTDWLASCVHSAMKNNYAHDYGVGIDRNWSGFTLAILRQTNMPSILLECGFMDYHDDAIKMLDPKWYGKLAEDVCKGICNYFGIDYKEQVSAPTVNTPTQALVPKDIVKNLQSALNLSYGCGLVIDGYYGDKTKSAVSSHPLKRGLVNSHVKWLQIALKIDADGSFGANTELAVKNFQKANGLTVDGYAGLNTHNKIIELDNKKVEVNSNVYYRVITGSYTQRSGAEEELYSLKKLGYDAFLLAFEKDGTTYLRVVAVSLKNKSDAEREVSKLKNLGYDAFISIYEK